MDSSKRPVGIVGLGIMGTALSVNLVKAGFPVIGYDIDPSRMQALSANGGTPVGSAKEVAARCELIVTSLPSPQALSATVNGPAGLLAAGRKDLVVTECSTLALADKQTAHDELAAGGITLLDSPLSGTGSQAERRDILVYCSGDKGGYERMLPIYQTIAKGYFYLGLFGNGSRVKFIANLLVSIHNVAAAEAMVLAKKAGLDPMETVKAISGGGGTSKMFEVRAPLMVKGEFSPAQMKMEMWMKDMHIIGDFADGLRCPVPLFSASAAYYAAAMSQGRNLEDTASVFAVMEQMAGVQGK